MTERSRLLVLDLLESFARERDVNVRLERRREDEVWTCTLSDGGLYRRPVHRLVKRSEKR